VRVTFLGVLVRAAVEVAPGLTLDVAATRDAAAVLVEGTVVSLTFSARAVNLLPVG
jgi:hypothetical protein